MHWAVSRHLAPSVPKFSVAVSVANISGQLVSVLSLSRHPIFRLVTPPPPTKQLTTDVLHAISRYWETAVLQSRGFILNYFIKMQNMALRRRRKLLSILKLKFNFETVRKLLIKQIYIIHKFNTHANLSTNNY